MVYFLHIFEKFVDKYIVTRYIINMIYQVPIYRGAIKGDDMMEKDIPLTEAMFYILLAVRKPNHGYGIIQEIEELTKGRVVLGAGTLYGAIQTLQKKDWICIYSVDNESRKKKEYIITENGKKVFEAECERLEELLNNSKKVMEDL